jgi:thioester reductase-like protein
MGTVGSILLTGATGFLGRYLLRELLRSGREVAVLVRDSRTTPAPERLTELLPFWRENPNQTQPRVVTGDLKKRGLGLSASDHAWLAAHCQAVVHAAAVTQFNRSPSGEPWQTNLEGTRHLLDLCRSLGIAEFHHISTAFVCGDRRGPIREEELDCGQEFHNEYERSKCAAEQWVHRADDLRTTIYRPSVIVGDRQTGYTNSYHSFYRFLELADRLAEPGPAGTQRRRLPLRLPFTGDEPRNLVPVDWVAEAVVRIVSEPRWHGHTYHLTSCHPVPARAIKDVAVALLGLEGIAWAGQGPLTDPSLLEEVFLEHLREYRPYFAGDPTFDQRNTQAALGNSCAPLVDQTMLTHLIRFAIADRWGRSRRTTRRRSRLDCAHYVEQFFPESACRSPLARVPLTILLGLHIRGSGGGCWSCRWRDGKLVQVSRDLAPDAAVIYHTDTATFEAVIQGRQTPQDAFGARQIEIEGDIEKGLKLAVLFEEFVKEFPYRPPHRREAVHATSLSG